MPISERKTKFPFKDPSPDNSRLSVALRMSLQ